jgi:predicted RNase H-like nuclease
MLSVIEATFIGIDLAWRSEKNPSGGAVLRGDRHCARLMDLPVSLGSSQAVLSYIEDHATASTCVAIDAPLIIGNRTGQRPCETLIGKQYGARHASCHSSNLSLYPQAASVHLASQLVSRGFRHAPDLTNSENQRVILEVYPHPALVELFRLPSIIKYKKGNIAQKRSGQWELQARLREISSFAPPLESTPRLSEFLATNTNSLGGAKLKAHEDGLDAIVCAYIAYYYWFWGPSGTRLFGDVDSGYIILPIGTQTPSGLSTPH